MKHELELMDWKAIERSSLESIQSAHKQLAIAKILLRESVAHVKLLHGQTEAEIDEENTKAREQSEANST